MMPLFSSIVPMGSSYFCELWLWEMVLSIIAVLMVIVRIGRAIWWRPTQIRKHLEAQGISGPPYKLLFGNIPEMQKMLQEAKSKPMEISHRILPRVMPHCHSYYKYGRLFLYWFGPQPRLNIQDVDLVKEILSTKFEHFQKPPPTPLLNQLGGGGLTNLEGEQWAKHRRIITPAFHLEHLKNMMPTVAVCAWDMFERWEERVEIEVSKEFRDLAADVIARTAFGSSYAEGKHIFQMLEEQIMLVLDASRSLHIPGFRFLPTMKNRRRWKLDREIKGSLRKLINGRELALSKEYGNDFLGVMMANNKKEEPGGSRNMCMTLEELINECKIFFFAGHETTSVLLTWTMVLLAMHQEWQEKARAEVLEVCGKDVPNSQTINRLKTVTMILNESLRLYPPGAVLFRYTYKEIKLGGFTIPAGMELILPILAIHHDPKLWGDDVDEFKPQRFAEGVAKAVKHPAAFMPFSLGPRICVGLNFSMIEAKVVMAMILQRFSFSLSPSYSHAPAMALTLQAQHGAHIILRRL